MIQQLEEVQPIDPEGCVEILEEEDKDISSGNTEDDPLPALGENEEDDNVQAVTGVPGLSIPFILEGTEGRQEFMKEVKEDVSLGKVRAWADGKEKGYFWENGLLKHQDSDSLGELVVRLVVPKGSRGKILKLAHNHMGHLAFKKVKQVVGRLYTWPRVNRDILDWCRQCERCQKAKKANESKAPLQPIPVLTEPFEKLAFDLVGPFPRSVDGFKYVLTGICLATRYPEAIPLKDIRAETVAEGMVEVFSRSSIPRQLLTDQGSQFVGQLTTQLCRKLNIEKLRTTPYHPQSNGCLERFHGTLVPVLKKSLENKLDWARQLKFALFACRSAPNRDSGFSPFELVFGRIVRGPLELLRETWDSEEKKAMNVSQWVEELGQRLEVIRDTMREKMVVAKEKLKRDYDRGARLRSFDVGEMVLMRIPGLAGKLEDAWDGPYEINRKLSDVNYEICVPNCRRKTKIVHVNNMKAWVAQQAQVFRIVVSAEDDNLEKDDKIKLRGSRLTDDRKKELDKLLQEYADVLGSSPGLTGAVVHSIDTGDSKPIRSLPYRLCPAWRQQVRNEIDSLLAGDTTIGSDRRENYNFSNGQEINHKA